MVRVINKILILSQVFNVFVMQAASLHRHHADAYKNIGHL